MIYRLFVFLSIALPIFVPAQVAIRGLVSASDSSENLAFAYIVVKSSGSGTMSDHEGRFSLTVNENDTIICTYVGYLKEQFPVTELLKQNHEKVVLRLKQLPIQLSTITVSTFKIKPYEREYMNDIIERSTINKMDYANSPISALYMRYSKEGKQINKLARIFEQLLLEEQVHQKLSRETLVKLTGDENIDYNAFRKYCYYVSDYYIANHDGVELYSKVMECYRNWKTEGRDQPLRLRESAKPKSTEQ